MINTYLNKQDLVMVFIAAVIGYFAVLAGYWQFSLWGQVNDIYVQGWSVPSLFQNWHPHALRYLIVYPIYFFADLWGIAPNMLFSWIGMIMVIAIPVFLFYAVRIYGMSLCFAQIFCGIAGAIYFVLAMFMNGRMIFAHLGVAILLFAIIASMQIVNRRMILLSALLIVIGALFCSVSTGVFAVAYSLLGVSLLYELFLIVKKQGQWLKVLLMMATLLMMTPWMLMGVNKNISFFGGGVEGSVEMLAHGSGQVILESIRPDLVKEAQSRSVKQTVNSPESSDEIPPHIKKIVGYTSILFFIMMILISPFWLRGEPNKMIVGVGLMLALILGQLGLSTLTLVLPIGLIFLSVLIYERLAFMGKFKANIY